jgi:hypothetical protein
VLSDAIEDARRIRQRIDALADAAAELLRDVRRDADRLTAELGFEPELLHGVVQLDEGDSADAHAGELSGGAATAEQAQPDTQAHEAPASDPMLDLSEPEEVTDAVVEPDTGDHERLSADRPEQTTELDATAERNSGAEAGGAARPEADEDVGGAAQGRADEEPDGNRAEAGTRGRSGRATTPERESEETDHGHADTDAGDARTISEPCPACDRTGRCQRCDGSGRRLLFRCSACRGSGRCNVCGGPGFIWSSSAGRESADQPLS